MNNVLLRFGIGVALTMAFVEHAVLLGFDVSKLVYPK